jgi:hypothetical protein
LHFRIQARLQRFEISLKGINETSEDLGVSLRSNFSRARRRAFTNIGEQAGPAEALMGFEFRI